MVFEVTAVASTSSGICQMVLTWCENAKSLMNKHKILVVSIHHICSICDEVFFSVHQV
jgi:hypothetical protein